MNQRWRRILGQVNPVNPGAIDVYLVDTMGVIIKKESAGFPMGVHIHGGYEFLIPHSPTSHYKVEGNRLIVEQSRIFPFNPEQAHSIIGENADCRISSLLLEADFMRGLASSIYNISNVCFENVSLPYDAHLKGLLQAFTEEVRRGQGGHEFITQSLATQVGVHLLRTMPNNCPISEERKCLYHRKGINQAIEFIHENFNREFSLDDIARIANLSPYHFSRVFKAEVGKAPFEYLLDIKIEKAKEYLRSRNTSVTEVCFASGFNDLSHFTRTFSKRVGVTPSTFRRQHI